jgi:hypothetical protein
MARLSVVIASVREGARVVDRGAVSRTRARHARFE